MVTITGGLFLKDMQSSVSETPNTILFWSAVQSWL